jgi:hypothetical protein
MLRATTTALLVTSALAACVSGVRPVAKGNAPATARATPYDTTAPDMEAARAMLGCYSVSVGGWSDVSKIPGVAVVGLPSRIRLDTARHDRFRPGFELVARTLQPSTTSTKESLGGWSPVGADSLQLLAWANRTSSVELFLRQRAVGAFEGKARFFWDQIVIDPRTKRWLWEVYPTAPATLTEVPCS